MHLIREGGRSHRRILHAADATGWAIQDALDRRASATDSINVIIILSQLIRVLTGAVDLELNVSVVAMC